VAMLNMLPVADLFGIIYANMVITLIHPLF
jgi:hypothetical protein